MEENPTTTLPVSETPTPLPTEASAKERPVIPNSSSSVIPGLTRNPESKKKFPLKLIIGIIIFLLLATGAAASYVYKDKIVSMVAKPTPTPAPIVTITPTPIPDPTADWKIHNNLTNGYSFKHPTDWSNMGSDEYEIFVPTLNPSHFPAPKEGFTITTAPNEKEYKFYELYEKKIKTLCKTQNETKNELNIKKITIDNHEAVSITNPCVSGPTNIHILVANDDTNIVFENSLKSSINKIIFDQILSTFKFTDATTIDTSSWKTYIGNNIEFKYLPNGRIITNNSADIQVYVSQPNFTFNVNIQNNVNSLTTKQVADNLIFDIRNNKNAPWAKSQADQMQQSMKDYAIGQIKGIKLQTFGQGSQRKDVNVIMIKNNKIYKFTIYSSGGDGDYNYKDAIRLDQILSTFKFTDSDVTPVPTCMQRPACLNATPRCMIAEPASGWCP